MMTSGLAPRGALRILFPGLLLAVTLVAAAAPVAAQLVPIGTPFIDVIDETPTDVKPQVAMDENGDFLVVWSADLNDLDGPERDILARRFDRLGNPIGGSGGMAGAAFRVNQNTVGAQADPKVTYVPGSATQGVPASGTFFVSWTETDTPVTDSDVFGNFVTAGNALLYPAEKRLSDQSAEFQAGTVSAARATEVFVAWGDSGAGFPHVRGRRIALDGTFGTEKILVPSNAGPPAAAEIAMDDAGNYALSWNCYECSGPMSFEEVRAQAFTAGDLDVSGVLSVNDFTIDNQVNPSILMRPGGEFLVTWDRGPQSVPHLTQYDAAGGPANCASPPPCERPAAEDRSATFGFKPLQVDPAMAANGSFATVFETFVSGPGARIDGLVFDANGTPFDAVPGDDSTRQFVVHDSASRPGAGRNPQLANDGKGLYVVVYDNSDGRIQARVFQEFFPKCGDPDGDHKTTATEARAALLTAVGAGSCAACLCDVDRSGVVVATDARRMLQASVGQPVALSCVSCLPPLILPQP